MPRPFPLLLIALSVSADREPMAAAHGPKPDQLAFFSLTSCAQKCILACQSIMAENQKTFFLCPKLRPVQPSISDRFLSQASWPWILFLVVLLFSVLFCCICTVWSCCCKGRQHRNDIREPLAFDRRLEDVIDGLPIHHSSTRGERISGSKFVVDV